MTRELESSTLDDAVAAVRDDAPVAGVSRQAAVRVWERLAPHATTAAESGQPIHGCPDVRGLLPAYREGQLGSARALLVDDHLRECPGCRAELAGERRLALLPWRPRAAAATVAVRRVPRWVLAASVVLVAGLAIWAARRAAEPVANRAAVQSISGALQRLAGQTAVALAPGQNVGEAEAVRTARGSRAMLRLRDGSLVEMGERAELSVTARGEDITIHLARGSIIVQAAKRRVGHLRVASADCSVEVTGTVFTVNRGLKGSRVSVLEGQVRVAGGGAEALLAPGQQWTTGAAIAGVPLRDEVAWSGEVDRHLALLAELKVLGEQWRSLPKPGLRYASRLPGRLPATTVVFASLPNYGEALADAHRLFAERLAESPVLRELWAEADPVRHGGPSLASVIERVRTMGEFLGDEVALAVVDDRARGRVVPLVLAEVRGPGLREFLESDLNSVVVTREHRLTVRIVGEPTRATAAADVFVLLRPDLLVMSVDEPALLKLATELDRKAGSLDGTPFGERIAQAYSDGAGLLFAVDFERITSARREGALQRSGLDGLGSFVLERKDVGDEARTQAVLSFRGVPRGIPSWLAAPAPMGSLEFVSPNAQAVAAFVVKSPALIFDDVLEMAASGDHGDALRELESKHGVRLRADLAETLGGEIALALDGPLLPTPAWKIVVEVYDPAHLQSSMQLLVNRVNDGTTRPLSLEAEQVDGETWYALRGDDLPFEFHYAYAGGYLVGAPSRALVMKALATRASGQTLAQSAGFRALFSEDRDVNVSGLVYQNLGRLVGGLLDAPGSDRLSAEQRQSVHNLTRQSRPTLVSAVGEERAIRVTGVGPLVDVDTSDLTLPVLLGHVLRETLQQRATP